MNENERDKQHLRIMMKIPREGPFWKTPRKNHTLRIAVLDHEIQSKTASPGSRNACHRRGTVNVIGKDTNFGGRHF